MPSVSRLGRLSVGTIAILFIALAVFVASAPAYPVAAGGGSCGTGDMIAGEVRTLGSGCTVAGDTEIQQCAASSSLDGGGTGCSWRPLYDSDPNTGSILYTASESAVVRAPWGAGVGSRGPYQIILDMLGDGCGRATTGGCDWVFAYPRPTADAPIVINDSPTSTIANDEVRLIPNGKTVPFRVDILTDDLLWASSVVIPEEDFILRTTGPAIVRAPYLVQILDVDPWVEAQKHIQIGCGGGCRRVQILWWPENRSDFLYRYRVFAPFAIK